MRLFFFLKRLAKAKTKKEQKVIRNKNTDEISTKKTTTATTGSTKVAAQPSNLFSSVNSLRYFDTFQASTLKGQRTR